MCRILIVVAHPDDEILGCGATIAKHSEKQILYSEAQKAANDIGANNLKILDFPDNSFDTVSFIDIVKEIELFIEEFQPEIIYTHRNSDLNIDHQMHPGS